LLHARRETLTKVNVEKFANFAKGVHGHELPNYLGTD
jgi:hypothetical protein